MEIGAFFEFPEERGGGEAFVHHEIGEASGVEIESGVRSGGGDDIDALELNGWGVPVAGIFGEANAIEGAPFFEEESAITDEVSGFARPIGEVFGGGTMDGEESGEGAEIEEEGGRIFESDLEGEGVEGADADRGEVRGFAFAEVFGALDVIELVSVFGSGGGEEGASPGEEEIGGGDGVAIAPDGIFAEEESVGEAIWGDRPAFGDAWLGDAVAIELG